MTSETVEWLVDYVGVAEDWYTGGLHVNVKTEGDGYWTPREVQILHDQLGRLLAKLHPAGPSLSESDSGSAAAKTCSCGASSETWCDVCVPHGGLGESEPLGHPGQGVFEFAGGTQIHD